MVAYLLSRGADVLHTQPGSGMTLLHMVCQGPECGEKTCPRLPYLTSFLVRWHVGVPQNTAAVAVLNSFTEAVKVLLDHGADVDTHCAKVKSTLHHLHSPCCFDTAVVCCHLIKPTLPGVWMSIVLHLSTSVTVQILCRIGLLCVWHVMTCQGDN